MPRDAGLSKPSPYNPGVSNTSREAPRTFLINSEGSFLTDPLRDDATPGARAAQVIARTIDAALRANGRSLRHVAAEAGTTHATLSRTMRGETFPDIDTVANLQAVLGVRLWPPAD